MRLRTAEEKVAYSDGFIAAYKLFCGYLKSGRSKADAMKRMEIMANAVMMASNLETEDERKE